MLVLSYILNRFYCFFEDHADVVRQIIVKRGNEDAMPMYNKTVIEFDFCDIPNYQGLCKCFINLAFGKTDNTYTLIILDITKSPSNNCL